MSVAGWAITASALWFVAALWEVYLARNPPPLLDEDDRVPQDKDITK